MRPSPPAPKLTKSKDRWLAGVCGGIADFLGWRAAVVRVVWLTMSVISGLLPGVLIYTVLALVMPPPPPNSGPFDLERFRVQ